MSKSDDDKGKIKITSTGEGGGFKRFVIATAILVAISWGTAMIAVRMEGGRDFIQERLRKALGTEVTIDRASLGFPLDLLVYGLQSQDYEDGKPGFKADRVRISIRPGVRRRIDLERPVLRLTRTPDGNWLPERFQGIGDLPAASVAAIGPLTAGICERFEVRASDGTVMWEQADGTQSGFARGILFDLCPVKLPRKTMYYYRLGVYHGEWDGQPDLRDDEVEWLAPAERPVLVLSRTREGQAVPAGGFMRGERE